MDPSYNNSFGSFDNTPVGGAGGVGTNGAGGMPGVGGVSGGVSSNFGGAPVGAPVSPSASVNAPGVMAGNAGMSSSPAMGSTPMSGFPNSNPMGTQMPIGSAPSMPVSSGTEDIVIGGGTQSGKPKKGIIIALIVAAVVLIGGGLLAVVMTSGGGSGGGGGASQSTESVGIAFNQYMNYLVNGEEKNEAVSSQYDESFDYAIIGAIEEHNEGYMNSLNDKWNRFVELFNGSSYVQNTLLNSYVESGSDSMKFIQVVFMIGDPTDAIMEKDLKNGMSDAKQYLDELYKPLSDSEYESSQAFASIKKDYYNALIALLEDYKRVGCVKDGEVVEDCATVSDIQESLVDDYYEKMDLASIDNVIYDKTDYVILNSYEIARYIVNGGNKNE